MRLEECYDVAKALGLKSLRCVTEEALERKFVVTFAIEKGSKFRVSCFRCPGCLGGRLETGETHYTGRKKSDSRGRSLTEVRSWKIWTANGRIAHFSQVKENNKSLFLCIRVKSLFILCDLQRQLRDLSSRKQPSSGACHGGGRRSGRADGWHRIRRFRRMPCECSGLYLFRWKHS